MTSPLTSATIALGLLTLRFGQVERITYHPDGKTPESDTDHTVMLSLIACALAERTAPQLDLGLVAQFALIHDLVEVYAGDTPTLRIGAAERAAKHRREVEAAHRLRVEYGPTLPWLPETIERYERQDTPEARFVKALDKAMPKITHYANGARTLRDQGMHREELTAVYEQQAADIAAYAGEFPALLNLRGELVELVLPLVPETAPETARC
jgi:putative hydrolases of HD superfamily